MTERGRRDRRNTARRVGAALVALLVLSTGCAKIGPPGGGPVDSVPPTVLSTYPADGDVSVPRDAALELAFSEEMDRDSVERALGLLPPVPLAEFDWSGRRLTVTPDETLPDSSTIVLQLAGTARDRHGVSIAGPASFAFSTGAVVDLGVIAGTVTSAGSPVSGATVWACQPPVAPDSLGVIRSCGYTGSTDEAGAFRLNNVAAAPAAYSIVAFVDVDTDGRYDTATEDGALLPSAANVATATDSVAGIGVSILPAEIDSLAPGGEQP